MARSFFCEKLGVTLAQSAGWHSLDRCAQSCGDADGQPDVEKMGSIAPQRKKGDYGTLNRVAALFEDPTRLESIIASLKKMGDLERLVSKVATGRINPRELHQLKNSLEPIGPIKKLLADSPEKCLQQLSKSLNDHEDFMHHVTQSLTDAPPMLLHQGNVIREGVDADLDEYRSLAFSGKDYLLGIQKREAESTGITSLKIAYNKVFGYYLEVSNTHKDKVPTGWIRKQTLVNAERYITEELKVYEEKILQAESQLGVIESRLYQELVSLCQGTYGSHSRRCPADRHLGLPQ